MISDPRHPSWARPRAWLAACALVPLMMGASCGSSGNGSGTTGSGTEGEGETEGDPQPTVELQPGSDTHSAEGIPMPVLPESHSVPRVEREAPRIADLDAAEKALDEGFYEALEGALGDLPDNGRRRLLEARLRFATGRYEQAAQLAGRAAGEASLRREATTLKAEAQLAQGDLEGAARTLQPLQSDAEAYRAHLLMGRLLARQGKSVEARPAFMKLIDAYNDERITRNDARELGYVGMAGWGLESTRTANDAFQEANAAYGRSGDKDGSYVETQLEWARVFLTKYDAGHAEECVRDAMAVNPNHPVGHALMARIRIEQSFDFAAAAEHVERALEVNPNLVMAHITNAGLALRDNDIEGADEQIGKALAVDENDLEALSTKAAIRYLADDEAGFRRAKQEVLRRHRTYSEMYTIIADYAEWEHRYPDIVEMAREAVTIDSDDALAHATLGLNLLRMGDEEEGLTALRSAWRRDRYNVRVFNTLNLYDEIIPQYETFGSGPFRFRMHRDEKPVLERYVPRTLQRAWTDMVRRYGFTPEGPVAIELYSSSSHFALRTTGLPSLGVQGVCFGKVVTAISPRGGPFNWGQIDWHELAHVFHIQLSENHVPRWFTEGLAEYETNIARPEWKREMDHHLWDALENDQLPPLRLMNRAFTRARSAMAMMVAYYASTKIVTYIAEEYGFPKIVRMLKAWAAGKSSPEVIQQVLGVSVEELDTAFRAHERQRLRNRADDFSVAFEQYTELDPLKQAAEAAPQDATAQARYAAGLLVGGDAQQAQTVAARAIGIEASQPIARMVLARLALMQGDGATAEEHLRAILSGGRDGYELRLMLARSALGRGEAAEAKTHLEAAVNLDSERGEAWLGLVKIGEEQNDAALRLRALRALAMIEEHDRETNLELLKALVEAEAWAEAITIGEMGLYANPHEPEVHRLLAEAYLRQRRTRDALYEAETALIAEHPEPARVYLIQARAHMQAGNRNEARQAADKAREADPSVAEEARSIVGG
ncbi:MAG: tetratricopeptide repeat protein [Deltaproteobacteria bacterium]|nr:tetratricopeptide repeat protein [Deltaproteobacteria bacterium]